jgi:hypothetical protein
MSEEQKVWTTSFVPQQQIAETFGATDEKAGQPSGEELEGVPVMFNPTVESGKCFCLGLGERGEELQLHCTEETWRETKADVQAMNANRKMVRMIKAAVNRQKLARLMGTPNFG